MAGDPVDAYGESYRRQAAPARHGQPPLGLRVLGSEPPASEPPLRETDALRALGAATARGGRATRARSRRCARRTRYARSEPPLRALPLTWHPTIGDKANAARCGFTNAAQPYTEIPTVSPFSASGMLVAANDSCISDRPVRVDIDTQLFEHLGPNTLHRPATEAVVDALPRAELRMKVAPRRTCLVNPQDRVHEVTLALL